MLLDRFRDVKLKEVERLAALEKDGRFPAPWQGERPSFSGALRRAREEGAASRGLPLALIAEYKRASPSKGRICESVTPEDAVKAYAENGATCLSVLTEEIFFDGTVDFLARACEALFSIGMATPLLRKDFIMDPLQVEATIATPASAMLLIVRLTPTVEELRSLREQAEAAGIESVVEVFDEDDLALARESGARIIQVNARDLETLKVDRNACMELIRRNPPREGEVWIAASGMLEGAHLVEAAEAGFTAALVGTALMKDGRPGDALRDMLADARASLGR